MLTPPCNVPTGTGCVQPHDNTLGCDWFDFSRQLKFKFALTPELVWPLAILASEREAFPGNICLECSLELGCLGQPDLVQLSLPHLHHTL